MIKVLTWFKRRPDLAVSEFLAHWQGPHAELGCRLPGLRRYVQNPAHTLAYVNGREPTCDGVAETWFDDATATRAVAASPSTPPSSRTSSVSWTYPPVTWPSPPNWSWSTAHRRRER